MDQFINNPAVMQAIMPPGYAAAMQAMGQTPFNGLPQTASGTEISAASDSVGNTTALVVYNVPVDASESEINRLFPTANKVVFPTSMPTSEPRRSRGMAILRFNTPDDCQQCLDEIRRGREVEGRTLKAELSTNPRYQMPGQMPGGPERVSSGCCLVVHNLPWSVGQNELIAEFPGVTNVQVQLNSQGQSTGVAILTFSNRNDCSAALVSCACKMLNGRTLRGEIRDTLPDVADDGGSNYRERDRDRNRDRDRDRHRDNRDRDRNRDRDSDRDRDRIRDRDRDRDRDRRRDDDRNGRPAGGRMDDRRDRDSVRDRERGNNGGGGGNAAGGPPIRRGYPTGGGGPRITSAVIRRLPGESSDSDFDNDHNY